MNKPALGLGDCHRGLVVGLHRKMMPQEVYFLSTEKYRPVIFGNYLVSKFCVILNYLIII